MEVPLSIALIYLIPALLFISTGISNRDTEEVIFGMIWPIGLVSWLCGNK